MKTRLGCVETSMRAEKTTGTARFPQGGGGGGGHPKRAVSALLGVGSANRAMASPDGFAGPRGNVELAGGLLLSSEF